MKLPFCFLSLLAAAQLGSANVVSYSGVHSSSSHSSSSSSSHSSISGNHNHSSSSLSVQTTNGNTTIILDGKVIDLINATVVSEDDKKIVLSPKEVEGAKITINKSDNSTVIDFKDQHYDSRKPLDMSSFFERTSQSFSSGWQYMRQQMEAIQRHIMSTFSDFPDFW